MCNKTTEGAGLNYELKFYAVLASLVRSLYPPDRSVRPLDPDFKRRGHLKSFLRFRSSIPNPKFEW